MTNVQGCNCFVLESEPQYKASIAGKSESVFALGVTITEAYHNARFEAKQHGLSVTSSCLVVERTFDGKEVFFASSASWDSFQKSLNAYLDRRRAEAEKWPAFDPEEQCDEIARILDAIPMDGSISVLTGDNATGKSLVRSQLNFKVRKIDKSKNVVHSSMALRTGTHSHLGGLGVMLRDADWDSTSYSTYKSIQKAIISLSGSYLCLDEIEIGCSAETIMGMVAHLNESLRSAMKGSLGCLVITHHPYVVRHLDFDNWFSLDGYERAGDWLHRPQEPRDIKHFVERHEAMSKVVHGRMQKPEKS